MYPQYLADRISGEALSEALRPQAWCLGAGTYLFARSLAKLAGDCSHTIVTLITGKVGPFGPARAVESDRSLRCPRASSCLPCSPSLQAFPPVVVSKKKSSSWLIQSRSASSPSTPVSTNKTTSWRALRPATHRAAAQVSAKKLSQAFAKRLQAFWTRCTSRWENHSEGTPC